MNFNLISNIMASQKFTIAQLQQMRESEDHVEFKECSNGKMSFNGADKSKPADRRKCILGYTVALSNAGGGLLVFGMHDKFPHEVVGTCQSMNALGELENKIYKNLNIPVQAYELLDENHRRVVVIDIPCHPLGKALKFEDVALWRSGEELVPMPDPVYLSIVQEQEPDFSEKICPGITLKELDKEAINILKEKYSIKQKNPGFRSLSDLQALRDLGLIVGNKVTNAAVLLVGKEDVIQSRKAKKSDIAKIVGNHISETQLRRIIERLSAKNGPLIKTGKTTNTVYSIAPAYQSQIDILNKATQIGLSQMIQESNGNSNGNDGINNGKDS